MTLLELLVQELPKRSGWPEGYDIVCTNGYGAVWAYKIKGCIVGRELHFHSATEGHVTREQYEAAAQQPVWNGEGLPPVGVECEISFAGDSYRKCTVLFTSKRTVLVAYETSNDDEDNEEAFVPEDVQFRPIRSEADKKRDAFINLLNGEDSPLGKSRLFRETAKAIYDAIAAGKIPGVRIK